jgi:type I restriction enzyme R subunit
MKDSQFNESNTVEAFVRDRLSIYTRKPMQSIASDRAAGWTEGASWKYLSAQDVPRQPQDVLVESWVRDALVRLNPEIASHPDRADDVLYRLRAIILGFLSVFLVL